MWLNLFATLIFMLPRRGNQFCSGLRQTGFNLFYSGVAYIVLSLKWEWYPASHSGFCVMRTNLSHDTDWGGGSTNANHFFFFPPSFPYFFAFTLLVLKMNKKRWLIEDSISFLIFLMNQNKYCLSSCSSAGSGEARKSFNSIPVFRRKSQTTEIN